MRLDVGSHPLDEAASPQERWQIVLSNGLETRSEESSRDDDFMKELKSKKYPAKAHALKSAKELAVKDGLIFLPGQGNIQWDDSDMGPEFRQRKYFYYITGVEFPECLVTYEIDTCTLILWIPRIYPLEALYFGSLPDPEELKRRYDVDDVRYNEDLGDYMQDYLVNKTLYLLHEEYWYNSYLPASLRRSVLEIDSYSLQPAMDRARLHKDPYEIALIRRACHISALGHRLIAQRLLSCTSERDIHAIFTGWCISRAAPSMAYPVIAGAGVNASTLHYIKNSDDLAGNDLVVVDAGCEFNGYASDITRTLPLSGRFTGKAAQIYSLVERMQEACLSAARVGKYYYELYDLAVQIAIDGLLELGILKGDAEDIWYQGTAAAFFPHGLGHHVGLEVHDVDADLLLSHGSRGSKKRAARMGGKRTPVSAKDMRRILRRDDPDEGAPSHPLPRAQLEPGMVLTIEPGIYFCRPFIEAWFLSLPDEARFINKDVLEEYYPVGGVRIEDVILVTEDGIENLSSEAPKGKDLEDVIKGPTV